MLSVAMTGTEACLYVTWKKDDDFRMHRLRSFALMEADQYIEFRKHMLNVIKRGQGLRPNGISF